MSTSILVVIGIVALIFFLLRGRGGRRGGGYVGHGGCGGGSGDDGDGEWTEVGAGRMHGRAAGGAGAQGAATPRHHRGC